jgi:hypothetical protein
MSEKEKKGISGLFDLAEEGMDYLERALPDDPKDDLLRDHKGREIIDIPESVPIQQKLLRLRVELYTAAQTLQGEDLSEFRKLISEVHALLFMKTRRLPSGG